MFQELLKHEFERFYQRSPAGIYFCPGRVNLIGEHIDYNGGLVMPCAINMGTYLIMAPNYSAKFRFRSLNFNDRAEIPVGGGHEKNGKVWYNYPVGIIKGLTVAGYRLSGMDLLYFGNLPIGSGLSSSASIEMLTAFALNDYFDLGYDRLGLVKLVKEAENHFIGVDSGIMDPFAVAYGIKDSAMVLDCANLSYKQVPFELNDNILAVINTNKPRNLAESKYNERVNECNTALGILQQHFSVKDLCQISSSQLETHKHLFTDPVIYNRAKHVTEENERVCKATRSLEENKITEFGELMYQSHRSLKDLYEVSGDELDAIVEFSERWEGVIGARMTGAGFGGCAIALVKKDDFPAYSNALIDFYEDRIGYKPSIYQSAISDGVNWLGC
ncbi:MAG: galactokinase [Mucilaginibacter sp.]